MALVVKMPLRADLQLANLRRLCDMATGMVNQLTRIEPAVLEDIPQLTELLIDLFSHEPDFRVDSETQMRGLRLIMEQPNRGRIFVLRTDNAIIGMINLLFTISTAEGGFVILLEDIVIHHLHRGQGYGSQLLKYAIEFARQKNFLRITLLTDRINPDAMHFFESYGFVKSAMVPMRYWLKR
ncbi:MAG TPA: GNAT family N-acetyltransferase [Chthoniobacterales bacterium]